MRPALLLLLTAVVCAADDDPYCPRYPEQTRVEMETKLSADRAYQAFSKQTHRAAISIGLPRANFIDTFLFDKMAADGVAPAPLTTDAEFLRRVSIDLTGRIPQPEELTAFLNDRASDKRTKLVEKLLASDAYVSQFSLYFGNRLRVTRAGVSRVGLQRRNAFYRFVRDFVQQDRPYNDFVKDLLTADGDADQKPAAAFLIRVWSDANSPIQDFYDNLTDIVTTQFLGFKTECVSCHNGRGYLDKINLYLARKRRADFWATSAFFSRAQMLFYRERDDFSDLRFNILDRDTGTYVGTVNPDSPGMRPPRTNATIESPIFMLNGAQPSSSAWRADFARIVTQDRQFARAAVNYLWAYMFRSGIVDPPNAWDLFRVDPDNPPPDDWPIQNTHPALLEALTDYYIQNNYSIKAVLRLIANSTAWQLSSGYPAGQWKAGYDRYFARHAPRRLAAEEIYDAITTATQTETPMMVPGFDRPVLYANELPDTYEPSTTDGRAVELMRQFGRGNWWDTDRDNSPTLLGLLYALNGNEFVARTLEANSAGISLNRVARIAAAATTDDEAIRSMYRATLTREPTSAETAITLSKRGVLTRRAWLSRLQWALVNKLDFIFNY